VTFIDLSTLDARSTTLTLPEAFGAARDPLARAVRGRIEVNIAAHTWDT
jgi:hypothetical protein